MKTHNQTLLGSKPLLLTLGLLATPLVALAGPPPYVATLPPLFGGPGISLSPRSDFESMGMRQARGDAAPAITYTTVVGSNVVASAPSTRVSTARGSFLAAATAELDVAETPAEPIGAVLANGHIASAAMNTTGSVAAVNAAERENRGALVDDLEHRLELSSRALRIIKTKSGDRTGDADLEAAIRDTEDRARSLRRSLNAAERASAEEWTSVRSSLATEVEAYGRSIDRVEVVGSTSQVIQVK